MVSPASMLFSLGSIGYVLGGIVPRTPDDSILQQYDVTGLDGLTYAVTV